MVFRRLSAKKHYQKVAGGDARLRGAWAYFYFKEVFGRAIDLFEALLARIWYGLHDERCVVSIGGREHSNP